MVRLDHALCCRKGGLIIQGHNKIRDAVGDLAALVWGQVLSELVVKDASEDSDALIADLGVRGVWQSQLMALFDIRVVETDALSSSVEAEKKQKCCAASSHRRATFTPLCLAVDGLVGDKASSFLQHSTHSLSVKWDHSFSEILGWLHARLVWTTNVCIRGSRTQWQSLEMEDGAAIPFG